MTAYAMNPSVLQACVQETLGKRVRELSVARGELTLVVDAADYLAAATLLRDAPGCEFNQLIDLCAVDYSQYKDQPW